LYEWDGRPEDPAIGGWYWLYRAVDGDDLRHAAWYWCDDCRQWEAEPSLSFAPDAVAAEGWRIWRQRCRRWLTEATMSRSERHANGATPVSHILNRNKMHVARKRPPMLDTQLADPRG
jgi:hypothetical protein